MQQIIISLTILYRICHAWRAMCLQLQWIFCMNMEVCILWCWSSRFWSCLADFCIDESISWKMLCQIKALLHPATFFLFYPVCVAVVHFSMLPVTVSQGTLHPTSWIMQLFRHLQRKSNFFTHSHLSSYLIDIVPDTFVVAVCLGFLTRMVW